MTDNYREDPRDGDIITAYYKDIVVNFDMSKVRYNYLDAAGRLGICQWLKYCNDAGVEIPDFTNVEKKKKIPKKKEKAKKQKKTMKHISWELEEDDDG